MSNVGVNKVILLGNAGQNAKVKSTSGGKSVANFSLAINQPYRNKQDTNQRVEWVRCVAWGRLAQIAEKLVAKGGRDLCRGAAADAQIRGSGRWHENGD